MLKTEMGLYHEALSFPRPWVRDADLHLFTNFQGCNVQSIQFISLISQLKIC